MARPPIEDKDRPALIKCGNCGRTFGERVRQLGYETEDGSIAWYMADERVRCPHCKSSNVSKVGVS